MKLKIEPKDNYVLITVNEKEVTTFNTYALKEQVGFLEHTSHCNLLIDLSAVSFTDSSGISALLYAYHFCKKKDGVLVLANTHPHVQKVIQISQLETILHMLPSLEEAHDYIIMEDLTKQITKEG